jgi:electron transfer flavoprotein alpha subunit
LLVAILSAVAVIAVLIALARHVLSVGRAVRRFNDEVGPLADQIGASAARASDRAGGFDIPRSKHSS